MDQETWRFINTFAPWLSALGTLCAVVTSLYLARRSERLALDLRVGIRKQGFTTERPRPVEGVYQLDLFWICITNIRHRKATITGLCWRPVPWRKPSIWWVPEQNSDSSDFPITLDDGQTAIYASPAALLQTRFGFLVKEFAGLRGAVRLQLLRLCVSTSTGDVFRQKPEKELRQLFKELANKKPA